MHSNKNNNHHSHLRSQPHILQMRPHVLQKLVAQAVEHIQHAVGLGQAGRVQRAEGVLRNGDVRGGDALWSE